MKSIRELIKSFNKPYQRAVAINTQFIGDDNDYSCFLSKAVAALWQAGHEQLAFRLQQTDPLLLEILTYERFVEMMEADQAFRKLNSDITFIKNNPIQ